MRFDNDCCLCQTDVSVVCLFKAVIMLFMPCNNEVTAACILADGPNDVYAMPEKRSQRCKVFQVFFLIYY